MIRTKIKKLSKIITGDPSVSCVDKEKLRKEKILFIVSEAENCINTISETIHEIAIHSAYDISILNLDKFGQFLPRRIELSAYDGIILHNTVTFNPRWLSKCDFFTKEKLSAFKGPKIILKQDEAYRTKEFIEYLAKSKFDVLFTCWDIETAEKVYSPLLPDLKIETFLTGYVSEKLKKIRFPDMNDRSIDVGYRGSLQPIIFGRLAYEKHEIGDKFIDVAEKYGLTVDISSRWEDRKMGEEWFDFLGSCRCTLGVESGMSIVDIDGQVERDYKKYIAKHQAATEEQILEQCLAKYEKGIQYRAISPRHFEAIACFTTQILYEGDYQGILKPGQHYIPLKKDWSNIDEVVEKIRESNIRKQINERAFEEIILNPQYSFSSFIKKLDGILDKLFNY